LRVYNLTISMRDRRDATVSKQDMIVRGASKTAVHAAAENIGLALAIASGGVLVCVATQVTDTGLDWSSPMIDADEREIEIDWDDQYPHD